MKNPRLFVSEDCFYGDGLLLFVNLVENATVGEVRFLSLVPTAEVADVNQVHVLVKFLVLVKNGLVGRTVVVLSCNVLAFVAVEEV